MRVAQPLTLILLALLLPFSSVFAQQKAPTYDQLWKKVDSLNDQKGLPRSALSIVDNIYLRAKKENQQAQMIKALLYQLRLGQNIKEGNELASITRVEKESADAAGVAHYLLLSLTADAYQSYFQQHRYQFYNRTQTVSFKKEDPATWTAADFQAKVSDLYQASLGSRDLLEKTSLESFDPIIIKGNMRYLRPTLYDLLAFRALDYFKNDERDVARPAYSFELDDPRFFGAAAEFSSLKIRTMDTASLFHKALLVYQELLQLHAKETRPDALIDADLNRLDFVYSKFVGEDKDSLYLTALNALCQRYEGQPAADQAFYQMAVLVAGSKSLGRTPLRLPTGKGNQTGAANYVEAAAICRKVLGWNHNSEGSANCQNLLNSIENRELSLEAEKTNIPGQSFRALVKYRNLGKIYLRLINTEVLGKNDAYRYGDNFWKTVTAATALQSWDQPLPVVADYQSHSVEMKVAGLPVGSYLLLASEDPNFSATTSILAAQFLDVSGISLIQNGTEYFILDRDSGKPLGGASIQLWSSEYDYNKSQNVDKKLGLFHSDKNGYFILSTGGPKAERNLRLEITFGKDHYFPEEPFYYQPLNVNPAERKITDPQSFELSHSQVYLFTDRSIYRPGQTLYFKGIAVTKDFTSGRNKVFPGYTSWVYLLDANEQKRDSLKLVTNEYGSYNGKFLLPQGGLTGRFTLQDVELKGQAAVSVEEYKRPKFFVEYSPVKGTYQVNDSIRVTGSAKAYAGNNVDGAQVIYRVTRQPRFPYPWLFRFWNFERESPREIAHGITKTLADGTFSISFKASPDRSVRRELDPVFDYVVNADVTDPNGETRSGVTQVSVSYSSLQINLSLPAGGILPADSLNKLMVTTRNSSGEPVSAQVHLRISRLQEPGRLLRERFWAEPDQHLMDSMQYISLFPNDPYAGEGDYHNWKSLAPAWERTDSSNANTGISIPGLHLPAGWYLAEASTKDKDGRELKDRQYIQLYNESGTDIPSGNYLWDFQPAKNLEPGESAKISIGSAAKEVFLINRINKHPAVNSQVATTKYPESGTEDAGYQFYSLNQERKTFSFPVTEKDRGGFGVNFFFVRNNRFYQSPHSVSVPWTNKELTISYESFRDKTLPGSTEKWKLKITGYKKEKVAAEILGSMYDASLDQFLPHSWYVPGIWEDYNEEIEWQGDESFGKTSSVDKAMSIGSKYFIKSYDRLLSYFNQPGRHRYAMEFSAAKLESAPTPEQLKDKLIGSAKVSTVPNFKMDPDGSKQIMMDSAQVFLPYITISKQGNNPSGKSETVQVRKNFNETAFFLPSLKTDSSGNVEFEFTLPEALTRWKFQALAHTKDLSFGYSVNNLVTQKPLMVQPHVPRFLREGDKLDLSAQVVNLTDKEQTGTVVLELINAATNQPVDGWFRNMYPTQYFTAEAGQSTVVKFSVDIPYQFNSSIIYRFVARTDSFSDGEEASLPVLTNSMLVTESMPLPMRGNSARNFKMENLLKSEGSETLQQHALTVEFTSNPAWYAVQSLPYLMEYPYECVEQTFNRYYANALASNIARSTPKIKEIFSRWNSTDSAALLSNLQKNPELKSVLLEETPWVLEAGTESQQKKNLALLFDMVRMSQQLSATFEKLKQMQSPNGGFVWFSGGPDDRYMTQYLVSGLGHLIRLGVLNAETLNNWRPILARALPYLDQGILKDYNQLIKIKADLKKDQLGPLEIEYLYMRSFFNDFPVANGSKIAVQFYRSQLQKFWPAKDRQLQAMGALASFRSGDAKTARDILRSMKENTVRDEESGMYWKNNSGGYYWHQAPVETQSLAIEAFLEINHDTLTVDELKTWLLKQKQTQAWETTRATAEACYALLLQGRSWLTSTPVVEIRLGTKVISSSSEKTEAGTGYFKQRIEGPFVTPAMGEITVKVASAGASAAAPSWGAVYWQYFEQLDKIKSAASPLKISRKLFVQRNGDRGPELVPVNENDYLKVGDQVRVRIEIRSDRDLEYVHLKDMRASCMEPVNVLSGYKWQDGLGYYESTRDVATHFFIDWLPKGTYVFEYPMFVTHTGTFSNGISSIQCLYAPEFGAHSEGIKVNVEENK